MFEIAAALNPLNVKIFLTASFTVATSGWDPKIAGAGVKHHGESLRWSAKTHLSIVLGLGGK